tara:strand:- start:693 stop:863 length:171 start_codon:yes stop_codon:yes gene_type:complete
MKKLFILLILTACSSSNINNNLNNEVIDFNKELSFEEFRVLLDKFNNISNYPDINN